MNGYAIVTDSTISGDNGVVGPFKTVKAAMEHANMMAESLADSLEWEIDREFEEHNTINIVPEHGDNSDGISLSVVELHDSTEDWLP